MTLMFHYVFQKSGSYDVLKADIHKNVFCNQVMSQHKGSPSVSSLFMDEENMRMWITGFSHCFMFHSVLSQEGYSLHKNDVCNLSPIVLFSSSWWRKTEKI